VLLEGVLILALLSAHLAEVFVLPKRHYFKYNIKMIDDKFIFGPSHSVLRSSTSHSQTVADHESHRKTKVVVHTS
jgi:hypothetical protein